MKYNEALTFGISIFLIFIFAFAIVFIVHETEKEEENISNESEVININYTMNTFSYKNLTMNITTTKSTDVFLFYINKSLYPNYTDREIRIFMQGYAYATYSRYYSNENRTLILDDGINKTYPTNNLPLYDDCYNATHCFVKWKIVE